MGSCRSIPAFSFQWLQTEKNVLESDIKSRYLYKIVSKIATETRSNKKKSGFACDFFLFHTFDALFEKTIPNNMEIRTKNSEIKCPGPKNEWDRATIIDFFIWSYNDEWKNPRTSAL